MDRDLVLAVGNALFGLRLAVCRSVFRLSEFLDLGLERLDFLLLRADFRQFRVGRVDPRLAFPARVLYTFNRGVGEPATFGVLDRRSLVARDSSLFTRD